jgi:hypothetical protein
MQGSGRVFVRHLKGFLMHWLVLAASLTLAALQGLVPAAYAADAKPAGTAAAQVSASSTAPGPAPAAAEGAQPSAAPSGAKPAAPSDAKPTTPAAPAAKPTGPVPPEAMNGLSFEGLTEAQKQLVVSILNDSGCDCGCGMKLAVCRRDDSKCTRSLALSQQVIDLVKKGKTREEIVKAALTPPSKFVAFDLKAGDAPAAGPADAKVTILHYLDYQ